MSLEFLSGAVADALKDYELRQSQVEMMNACADVMEEGGVLMSEAGTGTGKTFAYLVPLILSGKRGIISTRTLNLQEQLISKDLAFLRELSDFDFAIAKGRGNYLCSRRLNAFRPSDDEESAEYARLVRWANGTESGDIEDYKFGKSILWDKVYSDSDACRNIKCGYFSRCFYYKARQRWEKARILVANHALTGINAMLREDSRILPPSDVLVLDEAHTLDQAISDHIGMTLSRRTFDRVLNSLLKVSDRGSYKGLLCNCPDLFGPVESLRGEMELFWMRVKTGVKPREQIKGIFVQRDTMQALAGSIGRLTEEIRNAYTSLFCEDDEIELKAAVSKLKVFAEGMAAFPEQREGFVRWAEIEENRISLRMAPIYPKDFVKENIISFHESVILPSATLSVRGDFGFMEKILGLEGSGKLSVASPFDLRSQIDLEIRRGIDLQSVEGANALSEVIVKEAANKDGGILVLFTSREVMKRTWERSRDMLHAMGLQPMIQGELPNRLMLDVMRKSENSVIFGLDSFWEGVDVKGDSLKCLIITKLPFEVPTEPLVQARTEEIERNGGNPFYEYSLPKAVLKFKQGFGRLIRSGSDTGRVVICDERIETKAYGRMFLESLF